MGNKVPEEIENVDYEDCCDDFINYFIKSKEELKIKNRV